LKFLLALIVLAILALAGSRRVLFARSVPLGARLIFLTGTEFIIVGFLLGESYLGLIDGKALEGFEPFLAVGLGCVGLLFGLQFDRKSLQALPPPVFAASLGQSLLVMALVALAFYPLLAGWVGWPRNGALGASVTLGAAAACTGQPALAMLQRRFTSDRHDRLLLLRYIASVDALPPILALGVLTGLHAGGIGGRYGEVGFQKLLLVLSLAVVCGWLFASMTRERMTRPEKLLVILGSCALCGGMARQTGISILFSSMVLGLVVANISPLRARVTEYLAGGEKFVYVVLLILAGASLRFPASWSLALVGVYVAARMASKFLGNLAVTFPVAGKERAPFWVGLGLTSHAGMSLAIAIDFLHTFPCRFGHVVLTVVVLGIIVSELFGPALAVAVIGGKEEPSKDAS